MMPKTTTTTIMMMMTIMTISAEKASSKALKTMLTSQPCSRLHHAHLHRGSENHAMKWTRIRKHAAVRQFQHLRLAITCFLTDRGLAGEVSSPFGIRVTEASAEHGA